MSYHEPLGNDTHLDQLDNVTVTSRIPSDTS
jgi:hypothetical protein